ncbi:hypothetical protein [Paenibacillus eucommiae]|uniref:Uncharacterized protein n=1 Tax=Paenibacillus eucommiae TaxID=1355755 RepID=A0ABS4J1N9_9BACL|nr:hypothetical protein [Paenibacillus eucommiae]MBP1992729.1 hypothetical protein [Paenibacillus eucommiae]
MKRKALIMTILFTLSITLVSGTPLSLKTKHDTAKNSVGNIR